MPFDKSGEYLTAAHALPLIAAVAQSLIFPPVNQRRSPCTPRSKYLSGATSGQTPIKNPALASLEKEMNLSSSGRSSPARLDDAGEYMQPSPH